MATLRERGALFAKAVASLQGQVDELHVAFEHERGDAGKFAMPRPERAFVLTVDDDIIYPPDYAQKLVDALERRDRRAAVAIHGSVLAPTITSYYADRSVYRCTDGLREDVPCHVLGTGTLAYYTGVYAGPTIEDFRVKNMADIWFAVHAKRAGVRRYAIARAAGWLIPQPVDKLWNIYDSAHDDDAVQTGVLNENGPWAPLGVPGR